MLEGWVCPKCGRVNAPFVDHCPCINGTMAYPYAPYYPLPPNYPTFPYYPYGPPIVVTCKGTSDSTGSQS